MSTPDKCPHCGADPNEHRPKAWSCGTYWRFKVFAYEPDTGIEITPYCQERAAHAATKRELEMWKHNAGTAVTVAIERIQTQRDAAESRVRELEGFMGNARAAYRVLICSSDSERSDALKGLDRAFREMTNFGEAMPRKEGA